MKAVQLHRSAPASGNGDVLDVRPIVLAGFTLHTRSITVQGKPGIREWQVAMAVASAAYEASPYWVGALLNYAETREDWREKLSQAMTVTGLSKQRLENLAYVERHVEEPERRLAPSLAHAEKVAPLPRPEQTKWLVTARTEGWTSHELQAQILASQRRTVIEGQADTMFTVDVTVRIALENTTAALAEDMAWTRIKQALASVPHAHVIGAKAQRHVA